MVRLRFLGHAAFLILGEEYNLIIDPFISGNPQAALTLDDLPQIHYVFVTHGHGDHLGDTEEICHRFKSTVITNFEISNYLGNRGISCHSMHIGGRFTFPFGRVKLVPALHGSDITLPSGAMIPGGNPCGFLIEIEGNKIYHAGDTGLSMEMHLLKDEKIDIALLPIGGNFVMDPLDAAKAVDIIQPAMAVPIHYNTFDLIQADPSDFTAHITVSTDVKVLKPGEDLRLRAKC
ncbi:metal-dependent hydrolase [Aminobacterium mobile]